QRGGQPHGRASNRAFGRGPAYASTPSEGALIGIMWVIKDHRAACGSHYAVVQRRAKNSFPMMLKASLPSSLMSSAIER
ncbi:MAG: hypothetical protein QOE71_936, partial [Pseudonocardiales bacterium]|nr:hypothetical protein [Pseudonocardiales bacterium]